MSKILVTGATGQLGSVVVNQLLRHTDVGNISVLVRDISKADQLISKGIKVIKGNYNDYDSLVSAFKGIDKLYFVSSSDIAARLAQHENVVKAAIESNVGHIIYTSAQHKSEDGSSAIAYVADAHWKTDNLITQSGLTFTILKHSLYSDILPLFMGDKVIESGTIFLPAGQGKVPYASRADLGEAGAIVLTTAGHENKVYELAGTAAYSFHDIAEILSDLSGKTIQYISPTVEVFSEQLKSYGAPDEMIQGAATFCIAISQGEFDFPSEDLKDILNRQPQPLSDFLKDAYRL